MREEIEKYKMEIEKIIKDVTRLLGKEWIAGREFSIRIQDIGRSTDKGLEGYIGIYTFIYLGFKEGEQFLKVGQTISDNRFKYAHYKIEKRKGESRLANYIVHDKAFSRMNLNETNIEKWMRNNLYRIDILLKDEHNKTKNKITLNFVEGLLQYKFKPRYEGEKNS